MRLRESVARFRSLDDLEPQVQGLQMAIQVFREATTSANVGATTTSGMPIFARATSRRKERCRGRGKKKECGTSDWYGLPPEQGV